MANKTLLSLDLKTKPLCAIDGLIELEIAQLDIAEIAKNNQPDSSAARKELLVLFKGLIEKGRERAEELLIEDGSGLKCATRLSSLQDTLILLMHDYAITHVYRADNRSAGERLSIVAVGGYGRGTLAPGSDIDLLFVLPYKQTPWGESVVEYILYLLWDLRFKVGHATRDVAECVRLAKQDMTIRTALLEARYICGDRGLFEDLEKSFDHDVVRGTAAEFIEAKMLERDSRHKKAGGTRYLVEPNVKEGKGGLRDLHTLFWIAKYFYRVKKVRELVARNVFTKKEDKLFRKSNDFLWAIRCHMHFLTGRAEERLSFDLQQEMARRLNYKTHAGLRDVERFMKHYFLTAKVVGDLTRILSSRLESEQVKQAPTLGNILRKNLFQRSTPIPGIDAFMIDNSRIIASDDRVFVEDPVNLIRVFKIMDETRHMFHPDLLYLIAGSLKLIDSRLRANDEANALFLKILCSKQDPVPALRQMNEAGVLGRLIPAFGKIVAMMQFNMYHHYTVDEHTIRSIGVLSAIERAELESEHPLAHELVQQVEDRDVLYIAMFLHDIAKGRPEDHSIAGAKVALRIGKRFKLTERQTETISWLVLEHLTMSIVAQSRDLSDPKTIRDFAHIVQTPERLKLLLILTVCDIRAVGPGVWNGWKGQLLRTLYYETLNVLTGGYDTRALPNRIENTQKQLAETLEDWSEEDKTAYVARHYPAYLLRTDLKEQTEHANLIRAAERNKEILATTVKTMSFEGVTELVIYAKDHPRILNILAGACYRAGANIVGAQIHTTRDGFALDIIRLNREFDTDADELRRANRVLSEIKRSLSGDSVAENRKPPTVYTKRSSRAFTVSTDIIINNTLSNKFTVIEASGKDRSGLLFDLACAIVELNLNISSAHIATFGERAVDVFYVTDMIGDKIQNKYRQNAIKRRLAKVFEPNAKPQTKAA